LKGADAARETHMIGVDLSELDNEDREFLERWANAAGVPVEILILRIVEAIDGDQYLAERPDTF